MRVQPPRDRLVQPGLLHQREKLPGVLGRADTLDPERVERVAEDEVVSLIGDLVDELLAVHVIGEQPPQSNVHTLSFAFNSCGKASIRASSFSANNSSGPSFSIIRTDTGFGTVNGG